MQKRNRGAQVGNSSIAWRSIVAHRCIIKASIGRHKVLTKDAITA
jgi:hypothetical protein